MPRTIAAMVLSIAMGMDISPHHGYGSSVAFGEQPATEAARTKSNPHGNKGGANRAGLPSKKTYKAGSGVFGINEEVETLKKQNEA